VWAQLCCSVLQCIALWCSVVQCVAVFCSVLQCVAVCRSVLQCVAEYVGAVATRANQYGTRIGVVRVICIGVVRVICIRVLVCDILEFLSAPRTVACTMYSVCQYSVCHMCMCA